MDNLNFNQYTIILSISGLGTILLFLIKSTYEYYRTSTSKVKQIRNDDLKKKLDLFWSLFLFCIKHNHLTELHNALILDSDSDSNDILTVSTSDMQRTMSIKRYNSAQRLECTEDYILDILENLEKLEELYTSKISCLMPSGPVSQYIIQNDKNISWLIVSLKIPARKNKIRFKFENSF